MKTCYHYASLRKNGTYRGPYLTESQALRALSRRFPGADVIYIGKTSNPQYAESTELAHMHFDQVIEVHVPYEDLTTLLRITRRNTDYLRRKFFALVQPELASEFACHVEVIERAIRIINRHDEEASNG